MGRCKRYNIEVNYFDFVNQTIPSSISLYIDFLHNLSPLILYLQKVPGEFFNYENPTCTTV